MSLYEKNGMLGGLVNFVAAVKSKHENLEAMTNYFIKQLEVTGVEVNTGVEVDAELVKSVSPDVVIVATGGLRDTTGLKSTTKTQVISIDDVASAEIGQNVTTVGGKLQAVDIAFYLAKQGKNVTIVSPDDDMELGWGQAFFARVYTIPALKTLVSRIWYEARVTSVGDGEVTIDAGREVPITYPCDTAIECLDMLPNTVLTDELSGIEGLVVELWVTVSSLQTSPSPQRPATTWHAESNDFTQRRPSRELPEGTPSPPQATRAGWPPTRSQTSRLVPGTRAPINASGMSFGPAISMGRYCIQQIAENETDWDA